MIKIQKLFIEISQFILFFIKDILIPIIDKIDNDYMLRQARAEAKLTLQKQKQIELAEKIEENIDTQNKDKTIKKITREEITKEINTLKTNLIKKLRI